MTTINGVKLPDILDPNRLAHHLTDGEPYQTPSGRTYTEDNA